jgi:hypothetical protein
MQMPGSNLYTVVLADTEGSAVGEEKLVKGKKSQSPSSTCWGFTWALHGGGRWLHPPPVSSGVCTPGDDASEYAGRGGEAPPFGIGRLALNGNPLRFGGFAFGQVQLEHAIVIGRLHLLLIGLSVVYCIITGSSGKSRMMLARVQG